MYHFNGDVRQPVRVYLINDSLSQNNWGCRATTHAMHALVKAEGGHIFDTLKLASLEGRRSTPLEPGVRDVAKQWLLRYPAMRARIRTAYDAGKRLAGGQNTTPRTRKDFDALADRIERGTMFRTELDAMRLADLVMINGEGSIYNDQRKGFYSLFWAYFSKTRLKKPTVIVNHTLQLDHPEMFDLAQLVYPLMDDVIFREPASLREGQKIAPYSESHLAADAAFRWRPAVKEAFVERYDRPGAFDIWPWSMKGFDLRKPYICVTGSSALLRPDDPGEPPRGVFIELCKRLMKMAQVVVVAPDTTDEILLAPVARKLGLPFIPACTPTPIGLDLLANAAVFVSGRWHPSILASTGGTPSVMFSGNSHKMRGLAEILDLPYSGIAAKDLAEHLHEIVASVDGFLTGGEAVRNRVGQQAKDLAQAAKLNVRYMTKMAEDRQSMDGA